jgi:serine/threonine protein kinase
VVHRDLKPGNVMINKRKEPVIMDFGLARRTTEDGTRLTADGLVMGTPAYMAPEQARGDREAMGPGCDVYALGVLLYELLAGRPPFGGTIAEVLSRVLCDEPDRPSAHRAGLDPRLEDVCLKALAKSPGERYASARDLAEALDPWLPPAVPTMAAPPSGAVSAATPPRPSGSPTGGAETKAGPGSVRCPSCGRTYSLSGQPAGRSARCRGCGHKFQVRTVGRFQILDELGSGGFGVVYRVFDPKMDREAAVKVLHPGVTRTDGSDETLRRFRNEAKVLAQIVHPNILPLYEADQHEGQLYLVTALIRGRSLDKLVPEGGMPDPRRAVALVVPLLEALHYVHTTFGICHRDVKPGNVMVGDGDALFLMDFGLAACTRRDDSRVTTEGSLLGTPAYMPPEQAEGNLAAVGPWSDQYSAGVVLFHLLTGEVPFRKPFPAILGEIVAAPPPRPSALRPDLDAEIDALVLKALAKFPDDRHRDCREFADLLRDWAHRRTAGSSGAVPLPAPPSPVPTPGPRLGPMIWALALGGLLTAALLGTGAAIFWSKSTPTTHPAGESQKWRD